MVSLARPAHGEPDTLLTFTGVSMSYALFPKNNMMTPLGHSFSSSTELRADRINQNAKDSTALYRTYSGSSDKTEKLYSGNRVLMMFDGNYANNMLRYKVNIPLKVLKSCRK